MIGFTLGKSNGALFYAPSDSFGACHPSFAAIYLQALGH
jgi:hypothetical protein